MRNCKCWAVALSVLAVVGAGCGDGEMSLFRKKTIEPEPQAPRELDPVMEGTVAEQATLVGGANMIVTGWGLVVGLGDNGSTEAPPAVRQHLIKQLTRYPIPSRAGGGTIEPERIIDDLDSAVVQVYGVIPPGVPRDTEFDVVVEALPQTQTRSLDGGVLLMTDLVLTATTGGLPQQSEPLARASGPIFVNPFSDPNTADAQASQRTGRVLNGAVTLQSRDLRLVLYEPDHAKAAVLMRRLNERFARGGRDVANARSPAYVDLEIPRAYRRRHEHFLALAQHLFIQRGPGVEESKIHELTELIQQPDALSEQIALIWEAMGRQVLPMIQPLYTSENTAAAYYAARTGGRLGDEVALEVLRREAVNNQSAQQLEAIEELGYLGGPQSLATLRQLLNSSSQIVRLAAYEALCESGSLAGVRRLEADDAFDVDVVSTDQQYVLYATQTGQPRIVLFGEQMPVNCPLFFEGTAGDLVLDAGARQSEIRMWRFVGPHRQRSDVLSAQPEVVDLALTLGCSPTRDYDGQFRGLGLTYSQVVSTLYRLCEQGTIPATFVLQRPEGSERMYRAGAASGRPNTARDQ